MAMEVRYVLNGQCGVCGKAGGQFNTANAWPISGLWLAEVDGEQMCADCLLDEGSTVRPVSDEKDENVLG